MREVTKAKPDERGALGKQEVDAQTIASYESPVIYEIGEARQLLKGSGRHKNDDTGSRGFVVG